MRTCIRVLLYIFCVYIPEKEPNNNSYNYHISFADCGRDPSLNSAVRGRDPSKEPLVNIHNILMTLD